MDNLSYITQQFNDNLPLLGLAVMLLPLFSFALLNFFETRKYFNPGWIASVILGIALLSALVLFLNVWNNQAVKASFNWIHIGTQSGDIRINLGFLFDNVSVFMTLLVLIISFVVHLYTVDYMKGEKHYRRFFSLLGFFTFSMLGFILSDNLLMMFIFWELIGFSSYVLIGFWYHKPSASLAARKTFIINRIADIGFLVALMILWSKFGTFDLNDIKQNVAGFIAGPPAAIQGHPWLMFAGLGLFIAAIGKSAQFPLMVWLPDAMEGPIPVSALIHAATMVTAGVFMLSRVFAILTLPVLTVIALTGSLTAFMGAVAALSQYDLKKVLAYSTISQLGFMIMGIGVGAREAALFHLFTHAFFKAGLFLAAGMVIKSLSELKTRLNSPRLTIDPQDMRLMGGLRKSMVLEFITFSVFSAALAGIPFFSGFLSKDTILNGSLAWARIMSSESSGLSFLVPVMGFITSLLTVLYIGRALSLTFFGEFRLQSLAGSEKPVYGLLNRRPAIARIPVIILSVFSLAILFSINPLSPGYSWLLAHIKPGVFKYYSTASLVLNHAVAGYADHHELLSAILSVIISIFGVVIVIYLYIYKKDFMQRINRISHSPDFFQALSYNNWYLDRLYAWLLVRPFNRMAFLLNRIDNIIFDKLVDLTGIISVVIAHFIGWLDRAVVDGLVRLNGYIFRIMGKIARSIQSGKLQNYYIWSFAVLIILIIWWTS